MLVAASAVQREIIRRDCECVFCTHNFRQQEHAINFIPPIHVLEYKGKMFAACDYHAHIFDTWGFVDVKRRREMRSLLNKYLADKENPNASYLRGRYDRG